MNKLFTSIAAVSLGLTMAIGVGTAVGTSVNRDAVEAKAAAGDTFSLASSIAANDEITFVGINGSTYYSSAAQASNNRSGVAVTHSNSKITAVATTSIFKVEADANNDGYWNFKDTSTNKYLYNASGTKSYLRSGDTVNADTYRWSVSISNGVATISSKSTTRPNIRFNYNNGSPLFNCYASGQSDVYIYKKDAAKTLSSIAVTTAPTTTTYYVGDSFDPTGMVVTASYTSGSSEIVTNKCTFSPATFTTTGNQNVTVSYTEGGVTKTATQAVTVNAARTITGVTLLGDMNVKTYKDGDPWDVTGLYLSVTWSSGDPTTVQLTSLTKDTDYLMDPDSASEGDTSVDIEGYYEGFDFGKTVTGITVTAAPDVIDQAFTGVSGSGYTDWSGKAGSSGSGAVYAGHSSAGTDVQLRATSPSGIWTTASGGIFNGIVVKWNSSTAAARSIEIYGKNSAYASAELYDNSEKGTLIGTIANGETTIEGDLGEYAFIGIKPIGGALYLTEIDIYWATADPVIEYEDGTQIASLVVINGSTNTIDFNAKNFASVTANIFSNTPANSSSTKANLAYSVSGTKVTITATGKAVGDESFTISATGCSNTLTLNISVHASTTFDSLVITTNPDASALTFNEGDPFAVTGMVVTANFTVGGVAETETFAASDADHSLTDLTFTVAGNIVEIGDSLASTGTLSVVVSYTDTATSTTRSADAYSITVNAYVPHTWTKVTTAPADWRGTYLLGYELDGTLYAFNSGLETFDVTFNTVNTTDISGDVVTGSKAIDAAAVKIERNTVSGTSYYHALCANGQYLKSASKGINHQASATAANAVIFDGVSLKIGDYWLRFNTASNQLRFRFGDSSYLSASTASLYKMNVTDSINTEVSNFVSGFYSSIDNICDPDGVDTDVSSLNSAWTSQASAFSALSVDAQGILANTTYTHNAETPGTTKYIVDKYDYVYNKYEGSLTKGEFMNRNEAGTLALYSTKVTPILVGVDSSNIIPIIVIVSLISVSAIGGYFYIRRRKEQ